MSSAVADVVRLFVFSAFLAYVPPPGKKLFCTDEPGGGTERKRSCGCVVRAVVPAGVTVRFVIAHSSFPGP